MHLRAVALGGGRFLQISVQIVLMHPAPSKCTPGCSRIKISVISQKRDPPCGGLFFGRSAGIRIMSASDTGRLREPVQTLVNTLILFSRSPRGKTKCKRILRWSTSRRSRDKSPLPAEDSEPRGGPPRKAGESTLERQNIILILILSASGFSFADKRSVL